MAQFEVKDGVGIIPEGTTVMKDDGFKDCTELTSVVIPESVTDIYNRCFENCYNLSRIYYCEEDATEEMLDICLSYLQEKNPALFDEIKDLKKDYE